MIIPAKEEHLSIFKRKIEKLKKILEVKSKDKKSILSVLGVSHDASLRQLLEGKASLISIMNYNNTIDKGVDELIEALEDIKRIKK